MYVNIFCVIYFYHHVQAVDFATLIHKVFIIQVRKFVGKWHRTGNKNESISCNRISNTSVGCMVPDNKGLKYAEFDVEGASIWLDADHDTEGQLVEKTRNGLHSKVEAYQLKISGTLY